MKNLILLLAGCILILGAACSSGSADEETQPDTAKAKVEVDSTTGVPEMITTESGLKYTDLVVGTGTEAVDGMKVECHYTLWFADENGEKGKMLQSSKDSGKSFPFVVGAKGLIKGWNEGMLGMKEGGTRMLIVPPELGYGQGGGPIPPNQTLIFELEFLKAL